jgi:hypothetical protein
MTTGTNDLSTLLAARNTSAAAFGIDNIIPILQRELAAHNALVTGMLTGLAEFTTDRQRKYGSSQTGDMFEVDEYGRAPTQLTKPGDTVGFPLKLFQYAWGWTSKWFETKSAADVAIAVQAAERAHLRMYSREIKRAFMLSANYVWNDFLVDGINVNVKRLVNADSGAIPEGPNGEFFDPTTHTHYTGQTSLLAQYITDLTNNVVEHGQGNAVQVYINKGNETAFRGLSGFFPYIDPRLSVVSTTATPAERLDYSRMDNRPIGLFNGAEVWVKPWMPLNYFFATDTGSPAPLVVRQRDATAMQGLRIAATNDAFPLHAQYMEAEFGIAVWNRTNGAMLYSNNAVYQDPLITS